MNRLAYAWGQQAGERNRAYLESSVRRWLAEGKTEEQVLDALNHLESGAGGYVVVDRQALFRITGRITSLEQTFRQAMGDIHALESQTGLQWYMR